MSVSAAKLVLVPLLIYKAMQLDYVLIYPPLSPPPSL